MGIPQFLISVCNQFFKTSPRRRSGRTVSRMASHSQIEGLEDRIVLYAVSGNAWPEPQVVTIGFVPDGTNLGGVTSDLNDVFDSNPYLPNWQGEILRAAQVWSQATNINFVLIDDNGAASGSGDYQQGDPDMADIRIGGFDMGGSVLASAYMPPDVNNYSIAGDFNFNTAMSFSEGYGYDLFTIATHEFGHALGLNHTSATSAAQMWPVYNGVKPNLAADDIAGIRNIYSNDNARSNDGYETAGGNNTINDAKNISGDLVRSKKWAIIPDLDITSTSDVDFYKVNMPAWAGSTMVATVQSSGLSLLTPKLTIYDKDKTTILGTVTGTGLTGSSISLSIGGVTGTDIFYLKVEGANSTPFGMGAYGITLDVGADTPPVLPLPDTMLVNGDPIQSGGGEAIEATPDVFAETDLEAPEAPTIGKGGLAILVGKAEAGSTVTVTENSSVVGSTTADADGKWSLSLTGKVSAGAHRLKATATDAAGNVSGESSEIDVLVPLLKRSGRGTGGSKRS